jgi:eukaryotic-like serine/threonine-protein kinase
MSACLAETVAAVAEIAPAEAPRCIGRYRVLGTLGEGAMGVVYRAHDPDLDRVVALKTLRPALLQGSSASAATVRLRNEAQAAARLAHPGIVSVFEYGEDGDTRFIAMEYVRGTPLLAGLCKPEGLPVDDVLCLMVQLLAALQAAHEQGVWHRDIKPANLLVTPAGRLKVADFGIARIDAVALTHDAGVMGSPGYMAPECYRGTGVDQRADVYAAGVLLYELLAGVRPFRGPPDIVMYKTLNLPAPVLARPDAPLCTELTRFEHVVQRALAKSPDERWPTAQAMREALVLAAERPVPNALSAQAMRLLGAAEAGEAAATASSVRSPSRAPSVPTAPSAPPALLQAASRAPLQAAPRARQRFDAAWLDRLAARLTDELGPLARCVVQRAALRSDNAHALVMRLANESLPPAQRAAFIESTRVLRPEDAAAPAPPTGVVPPVLGESPLEPRLLAEATALLLRQLGPIASLLVKRAAAGAASREQFIARLADASAEGRERERLKAVLCRLR